jgi:hypothetical protein
MTATVTPIASMQRLYHFAAGHSGGWVVEQVMRVTGELLPAAPRIAVIAETPAHPPRDVTWCLRGITSNERYVTREEKTALVAKQEGLGRAQASCAAMIPIRKSAAWWAMPQDERRDVVEKQSRHIAIGLNYLPAIARRLHHCRDLGSSEPFDFITWFEYAPRDQAAFNELLRELRASPEWRYVEREVDIRLRRAEG